jgi:hypothetical protein
MTRSPVVLLSLLCLGLLPVPAAVEAQAARKVYRIALVNMVNSVTDPHTDAFVDGLRQPDT